MRAQPHSPPAGDRAASACRAAVAAAAVVLLAALPAFAPRAIAAGTAAPQPETVTVRNGSLVLHGLLWRPEATGPFPAVLFNHGSGATAEPDKPATLGPVFARHGYVFLFLYRRGSGLSADAGTPAAALMEEALAEKGVEASDALELELLDQHLTDARAGLEFLRGRSDVDRKRIAVAGHSFGGTLALLMAATDDDLRAAVDFAGAARSWASSDALRARLLDAVERTKAPVFFIHAENDYSLAPGVALSTAMLGRDKPRRFEVYSPVGQSMAEGHDLVYLAVEQWESDVFAFLEESLRP